MGVRGTKRKITEQTSVVIPEAPSYLTKQQLTAWRSIVEDLKEAGVITRTDRKLIELYARNRALLLRVDAELEETGLTYGSDDRKFTNPLCGQFENRANLERKLLLDFGLSPSTRKGKSASDDDPWRGIIGRSSV